MSDDDPSNQNAGQSKAACRTERRRAKNEEKLAAAAKKAEEGLRRQEIRAREEKVQKEREAQQSANTAGINNPLPSRPSFEKHFVGPDGWQDRQPHGSHNKQAALWEIEQQKARMKAEGTGTVKEVTRAGSPDGIEVIEIVTYDKDGQQVGRAKVKTVYDPQKISDARMTELAAQAIAKALEEPPAPDEPRTKPVPVGDFRFIVCFKEGADPPQVEGVFPVDNR